MSRAFGSCHLQPYEGGGCLLASHPTAWASSNTQQTEEQMTKILNGAAWLIALSLARLPDNTSFNTVQHDWHLRSCVGKILAAPVENLPCCFWYVCCLINTFCLQITVWNAAWCSECTPFSLYHWLHVPRKKKKVNESFILLTKILYFSLLFQTRFLGF